MSSFRLGPKRAPDRRALSPARTAGRPVFLLRRRCPHGRDSRLEGGASSAGADPRRGGRGVRGWWRARATSRSPRSRRRGTGDARSPRRVERPRGRSRPASQYGRARPPRACRRRNAFRLGWENTASRPLAVRSRIPPRPGSRREARLRRPRRRRIRRLRSQRQHPQRLELLDRLEEAAAEGRGMSPCPPVLLEARLAGRAMRVERAAHGRSGASAGQRVHPRTGPQRGCSQSGRSRGLASVPMSPSRPLVCRTLRPRAPRASSRQLAPR